MFCCDGSIRKYAPSRRKQSAPRGARYSEAIRSPCNARTDFGFPLRERISALASSGQNNRYLPYENANEDGKQIKIVLLQRIDSEIRALPLKTIRTAPVHGKAKRQEARAMRVRISERK